jgi:hypothetical protein
LFLYRGFFEKIIMDYTPVFGGIKQVPELQLMGKAFIVPAPLKNLLEDVFSLAVLIFPEFLRNLFVNCMDDKERLG